MLALEPGVADERVHVEDHEQVENRPQPSDPGQRDLRGEPAHRRTCQVARTSEVGGPATRPFTNWVVSRMSSSFTYFGLLGCFCAHPSATCCNSDGSLTISPVRASISARATPAPSMFSGTSTVVPASVSALIRV